MAPGEELSGVGGGGVGWMHTMAPGEKMSGGSGVFVFLEHAMALEERSPTAFECHLISISNLNLSGLFSTELGKRDTENIID